MHGLFVTDQLSARFVDLGAIDAAVARLLARPPKSLLNSEVIEATNLETGFNGLSPTPGMWLRTADDTRVVVRPSGTEPKLKCYLEVVTEVPAEARCAKRAQLGTQAVQASGQVEHE